MVCTHVQRESMDEEKEEEEEEFVEGENFYWCSLLFVYLDSLHGVNQLYFSTVTTTMDFFFSKDEVGYFNF